MITDFGRNSFVTHTTSLKERIQKAEKESKMPDPEYICLSCEATYGYGWILECPKCGENTCPDCGGEVSTIEEYDEAMKANAE